MALNLTDAQGNSVATADLKGSGKLNTTLNISNPAKWTAETPNLYTLTATLKNGNNTVEVLPIKVGFRKIELKGGQILVTASRYSSKEPTATKWTLTVVMWFQWNVCSKISK